MNTLEILSSLNLIDYVTKGVYAADKIPLNWSPPAALVFNTDDHTQPGTHWVAVYLGKDGVGTYFDSFGNPPRTPSHSQRIRKNCRVLKWNTRQLQSESSATCGHYCTMFLHYLSNNISLDEFHRIFSEKLDRNDAIVLEYYNTIIRKKLEKCKPVELIINHVQSCVEPRPKM